MAGGDRPQPKGAGPAGRDLLLDALPARADRSVRAARVDKGGARPGPSAGGGLCRLVLGVGGGRAPAEGRAAAGGRQAGASPPAAPLPGSTAGYGGRIRREDQPLTLDHAPGPPGAGGRGGDRRTPATERIPIRPSLPPARSPAWLKRRWRGRRAKPEDEGRIGSVR